MFGDANDMNSGTKADVAQRVLIHLIERVLSLIGPVDHTSTLRGGG